MNFKIISLLVLQIILHTKGAMVCPQGQIVDYSYNTCGECTHSDEMWHEECCRKWWVFCFNTGRRCYKCKDPSIEVFEHKTCVKNKGLGWMPKVSEKVKDVEQCRQKAKRANVAHFVVQNQMCHLFRPCKMVPKPNSKVYKIALP